MSRFLLALLLATTPLLAQTSAAPKHRRTFPDTDNNWVNQQEALQHRARQILGAELSRKLDPTCDVDKLSNAEFGNCFVADAVITQRNYRAFVRALKASLAIEPPNVGPETYPAARNFAAGEAAWLSYLDKTCEARGDFDEAGTGTGADMTNCQRKLTRQHMRDLNSVFLDDHFPDLR